jgi:hypothetical protein
MKGEEMGRKILGRCEYCKDEVMVEDLATVQIRYGISYPWQNQPKEVCFYCRIKLGQQGRFRYVRRYDPQKKKAVPVLPKD